MDALKNFANINLNSNTTNKFTGSIHNQLQAAREKFGAVDEADITILPTDYIELEKRVDALESVHKHMLKVTRVYDHESYDYPTQLQESISETSGHLWHSFSKFANENLKNVNLPVPSTNAPIPQPKTLSHALSRASATSALEVGESDHLGNALTKYALAHDKIGNARLGQDNEIRLNFLQPWQTTLSTSIALAKNARSSVRQARLWLDSCKQGLKTASPQKVEQARLEMESAEDKLVTQTETAITLMKNVLENPEPLTSLNKLVQAQLSYHTASVDALKNITGELEEAQRSAEDEFNLLVKDFLEGENLLLIKNKNLEMSKKDLTEAEKIAKKEKKERKEKKKQDKAVVEQQEKSSDNGNEDTPAEKSNDKKEKKDKKDKKDKKRKADKDLDDSSIKKSKKEDSNDTEVSDEQSEKFFKDNNMSISSKGFKPILSFDQLKVNESLLKPLKNFEKPTPIQSITWPCLLKGKDTIGIAETGSGKTLSFALPGLERHVLNDDDSSEVTILVIAPTRELAVQTYENVHNLNIVNSICLYGGVSKDDQKKTIKKLKPRVVVGTPGRLLDLVNDGGLNLGNVKYLVLDEADRMLDQGFEKDIRAIIGNTPKERQTAMFSATWPQSVRALASTFMTDPVRVTVGSEELTANKRVAQVIEVLDDQRQKDWKLNNHLKQIRKEKGDARVLIFALYKKEASRIENTLRRNGHGVGAIHGDLSQVQRMKALEDFKFGKVPLLVATDVAARGLDIPNVEVVINVTFPLTIEDYVHRIGRTGRGGKSGKSITFFTDNEKHLAGELQKLLREGGYEIPEGLKKFPAVIKKKEHSAYGAFYKDIGGDEEAKKPKKITFD